MRRQRELHSEDLPKSVSCYKLKNGSQVYFRHKYPYNLYSDSFQNVYNDFPPELSVKFAGEMNDSLHFYTETLNDSEELETKTFTFYKLDCALNRMTSMQIETIRNLTKGVEVRFATQQPYFLEFTEHNAIIESFCGERMMMSRAKSGLLTDIKSLSFFVWNGSPVIVRRNRGENSTIVTSESELRVIGVQQNLPHPNSVYAHENLLYMLCGRTLFVFDEHFQFSTYTIDHPYCHIGGVKDRTLFLNAPCLFYTHELIEEYQQMSAERGRANIHEEEVMPTLDQIRAMEDVIRRIRLQLHDLHLSSHSGIFHENYSVNRVLGRGGCGEVLEAVNKIDNTAYAVKRIEVDRKHLGEALKEVRAMSRLNHLAIVRYYISWIEQSPYDDGRVSIFIPMEVCKYSLDWWLEQNKTNASRVIPRIKSWFKQIVSGVEYLHQENLIHRDLKPGNILFIEDDCLKIADLGIVIERKMKDGKELAVRHNGSGTKQYMSPEQKSFFDGLDAKSDVFSLGLIFAELCVVMDYDKKSEIFDNYRYGTPNVFVEDSDGEMGQFINHLTKTNPEERPSCTNILRHIYLQ